MKVPAIIVAVACLLPASCESCRQRLAGGGPALVEFVEPALVAGIDGARWGDAPASLHAIEIGTGGITVHDAITLDRQERGTLPAVAVGGRHLIVGRGRTVERRAPAGGDVEVCSLDQEPTALLATSRGCFVGLESRVDHCDFSGDPARPTTVHREEPLVKPVDFLVPMERGLLAVDDEVVPKFAFVLRLDGSRPARHEYTAGLPSGPNETYTDVAVVDDLLVIVAIFGVQEGNGNTLYRWPISRRSDSESGDFLEEIHRDYQPGLEPRLLAGEELSHWNGLAVIGEHLFIGADRRGILHMPLHEKEARLHDVGGWCLDLVLLGGQIVALVASYEDEERASVQGYEEAGTRAIVVLEWDAAADSLVERGRYGIEPSIDWLVV